MGFHAVRRDFLDGLQQRVVLEFASFRSESLVTGIDYRTLQEAVFLEWILRHYKEVEGQGMAEISDLDSAITYVCARHAKQALHLF